MINVISQKYASALLTLAAIFITLFLFFIDEGYYNFNWIFEVGNWIAFVTYCTFILISELFLHNYVFFKMEGIGKLILSVVAGSIMGFLIVISLVFTIY